MSIYGAHVTQYYLRISDNVIIYNLLLHMNQEKIIPSSKFLSLHAKDEFEKQNISSKTYTSYYLVHKMFSYIRPEIGCSAWS